MFRTSFTVLMMLAIIAGVASRLPAGATSSPAPTGCWPARPHVNGSSNESLVTVDGTRTYRLHVPPSYNGADAMPLVLSFHGITGTGAAMEASSQFSKLADGPGGDFIAVYPQGLAPGGATHFNSWLEPPPEPDDVAFVAELLDRLESQLCIDSGRVYAAGFSNGAMMSVRIACSLASRVAAIAPVAGVYYPPMFAADATDTCPDATHVPLIAIHGTADPLIPFGGGMSVFGGKQRLAVDSETVLDNVLYEWAQRNGCAGARQESSVTSGVRLIEYGGCVEGATTELYAIDGGNHVWPDEFNLASGNVSTAGLIWQFFQAHPMPSAGPLPDGDGDTVPDLRDTDNDNDGCTDARELQRTERSELTGGQRNPNNVWDYFNPTHDGKVRVDDVLTVVNTMFKDDNDGTPGLPPYAADYNPDTDRTLSGPHPWNSGPPDGHERIDDVLNVVHQFFNDCS
jgi:polyhydroxybutyrate depolymerase